MIENIVRAIIIKENKILLARQIGCNYTFLPGGHIEFGETAETALLRELDEEIGISGKCGRFLCTIENIFTDARGAKCHEAALYFIFVPGLKYRPCDFVSKESHLEFIWAEIEEAGSFNLKPDILEGIIQKLSLNKKPDRFYSIT